MVNLKPSVFLFVGNDGYSKEKEIEEISGSLFDGSSRELDYKVFYGGEADAREIIDYINTVPFAASKRLAVVKGFDKLPQEEKARLIASIEKPLKSACLVLETGGNFEYSRLPGHVKVRRFAEPADSQVLPWMKKILASKGKAIQGKAAMILKELRGKDLASLSQELEKLSLFVGERKEVEAADVEAVVEKSLTASAFDLADAVEAKDVNKALDIVSGLVRAGKRPHEITGLLCWHFKKILRAKIRRSRPRDIERIRAKMAILLEADLAIKRPRYDPAFALEFAIIRLCLG
jgi:DNA polymerase-3 subunit delta